jgi:hypothetical protein
VRETQEQTIDGNCFFPDGNWSAWSAWTSCSTTCGGGNQTQSRNCSNPAPSNGGKNCSATNIDTATQICNSQPCPIGNFLLKTSLYLDIDDILVK